MTPTTRTDLVSAADARPEFDSRLNSYSKAVLAVAAVGALATTDAAAQAIVHNITSFAINGGTDSNLTAFTVQLLGGAEIRFDGWGGAGGPVLFEARLNVGTYYQRVPNRVLLGYGNNSVRNLLVGDPVTAGTQGRFGSSGVLALRATTGNSGEENWQFTRGEFMNNHTGYVGFKRIGASPSQDYFGWIRLRLNFVGGSAVDVTLLPKIGTTDIYGAYALGSINAGEVASAAIPEPAQVATGLGLLALGAVGVREFRRRRKAPEETTV